MVRVDERLSRKISRIGLIGAMLVVFIHSYMSHVESENIGVFASLTQEFLSQGVARIAVPFFFIVSGFFLYRDFEFSLSWFSRKLRSRFWSLGLPYVLWGLIGLAFTMASAMVARSYNCEAIQWASPMWWARVFGVVQKPLYCGQLWFVHMLLEWLALAPLVGWAVKKVGYALPAVSFVVMCIPALENPWVNALMYISLGACLTQRPMCLPDVTKSVALLMLVLWIGMLGYRAYMVTVHADIFSEQFIRVTIVVGLAAVWLCYDLVEPCINSRWLDMITGSSFFIYCSHMIFLALFRSPLRRFPVWECDILRYALPPLLAIISAVVAWIILGRIAPKVRAIMCGGRG